MKTETPERYFFKYAFPCAFLKLKGEEITKREYYEMERKFYNGSSIGKKNLERIFKPAFIRIKRLAERMQKDYWSIDVIKEYWLKEHNKLIDKNDGGWAEQQYRFKDLCKIHRAEIIEEKSKSLVVKYGNRKREVYNVLVPDAKKGDSVTIHFSYAIEKV